MERRDELTQVYCLEAKEVTVFAEPLVVCLKNYFAECVSFTKDHPHPRKFTVDFSALKRRLPEQGLEFSQALRVKPDFVFKCLQFAVHLVVLGCLPYNTPMLPVCVGLKNYDFTSPLASIRSALINQFVCVTGCVVKVSSKKPLVVAMKFRCSRCNSEVRQPFQDGKYELPSACKSCNKRQFTPLRASAECVNIERIRIQEFSGDEQSGVPLTLDCEAFNMDLSDIAVGDAVTVLGVIKAQTLEQHRGKSGLFGLALEINSLFKVKKDGSEGDELTQTSVSQILELARSKNIFHLLVKSFCEVIYGHEMVKAGLLLAMLGGNRDRGRSSIHVLVVGDPGLGKTQMLRATTALSQRGLYVSGSATKAGLTISVTREGGEQNFRTGALVMSDEGVCAVDELDKLGSEQQSLLEVMEQQSFTVSKAGIWCSLKARTTVIAAANPQAGRYNNSKSLVENLKMNSALLSRFDLIFLLLDSHDKEVMRHVIAVHSGKRTYQQSLDSRPAWTQPSSASQSSVHDSPLIGESFTEYMQRVGATVTTPLPLTLLKQYLHYAKNQCQPRVSQEAAELVSKFYISLRQSASVDGLPITTRQLEALMRLCEARAKVELSEVVQERHVVEIIKLYQETVFDLQDRQFSMPTNKRVCRDNKPFGELSVAKQQLAFLERLSNDCTELGSDLFTFQELVSISKQMGMRVGDFGLFIEKLNLSGYLLKKGGGQFKLVSL
jgi:DNA helicase MCM8